MESRGKVSDPFAPPYNTNLYVGEMKDDESQDQFVVLVGSYRIDRTESFNSLFLDEQVFRRSTPFPMVTKGRAHCLVMN
jgi:hypothetical protein